MLFLSFAIRVVNNYIYWTRNTAVVVYTLSGSTFTLEATYVTDEIQGLYGLVSDGTYIYATDWNYSVCLACL